MRPTTVQDTEGAPTERNSFPPSSGERPYEADELLIGSWSNGRIYRRQGQLGCGGMGVVAEGFDVADQTPVAIKLLRPLHRKRTDLSQRLFWEGETLAMLDHPHLVRALDFGTDSQGQPFLVMERLYGETLHEHLISHGPFESRVAVALLSQLLDALSCVHAADVVHRDIKPENIFLTRGAAGRLRIKLLDFGIASRPGERARVARQRRSQGDGVRLGTPRYMSPEQAFGDPVDARSDLYAAGLVAYCMLTGSGPFDEETRDRVLLAHCSKDAPPPSSRVPLPIGRKLDAVVLRALAKRPEHRYQTAEGFRLALGRAIEPAAAELRSPGRLLAQLGG